MPKRPTLCAKPETTGRLIDPHTAVAWKIAQEQASPEVPMVVLSTASPFKFCRDVFNALYGPLKLKSTTPEAAAFEYMDALADSTVLNPAVPLSTSHAVRALQRGL